MRQLAILILVVLATLLVSVDASCPDGHFCYDSNITLADQVKCEPSQYCPGNQAGQICAKGYYCPTVLEQLECPEKHYCPPGSIIPRPCSDLASCPSGSERYFHWGALILLIILLPLIFSAGFIYDRYNRWMRAKAGNGNAVSKQAAVESLEAQPAAPVSVPRMEVKFQNLSAAIDVNGVEKTILADVSGHFRAGRLIAVMGPSGAGKSSLINVLTGQVRLTAGSIETRIEGGLEEDLRKARQQGLIGVVPQADIMISCLTPRDILTHSAYTRLPATWTKQQKEDRIQQTLKRLNLERVQNTPVGDEDIRGVSGGEKKRVNIGIELVNSPSLLILDEPTTGLDATSSSSLISTLRDISKSNTTVVAVLHQPRNEIFRGLDDLLLLAPGGKTVYFGPARYTQAYFESIGYECDGNTNPSDFFIDVIAAKAGPPFVHKNTTNNGKKDAKDSEIQQANEERCGSLSSTEEIQSYLSSSWKGAAGEKFRVYLQEMDPVPEVKGKGEQFRHEVQLPSFFALTYLYCYRGLLQLLRSLGTVQLELFMHILAGCVIGMAFVHENWFIPPINPYYIPYCPAPMQRSCAEDAVRDVANLMTTYTVMALGLVASIIGNRCYGQELLNMQRESSAGLSSSAYFWGKTLSEFPLIIVYAFLYCVSYFLVSSPGSKFNDFFTALLLFEFVMFGIGYVSSLLLSGENALLLSAIASLLGGLATDNLGFVKSLCWARWVAEALYVSEARIDLLADSTAKVTVQYMTLRNNFNKDHFGMCILALLIYGIVLRLWAYGLVYRKFYQRPQASKPVKAIEVNKDAESVQMVPSPAA